MFRPTSSTRTRGQLKGVIQSTYSSNQNNQTNPIESTDFSMQEDHQQKIEQNYMAKR